MNTLPAKKLRNYLFSQSKPEIAFPKTPACLCQLFSVKVQIELRQCKTKTKTKKSKNSINVQFDLSLTFKDFCYVAISVNGAMLQTFSYFKFRFQPLPSLGFLSTIRFLCNRLTGYGQVFHSVMQHNLTAFKTYYTIILP